MDAGGSVEQRIARRIARFSLPLMLSSLMALPLATAARTGISPLNRVVELIGQMFNIPILQEPSFQVYFLRFMLFILFMAMAHYGLKRAGLDNKTSGIISAVFAIISAFLMPADWVTANGGVVTALFAALIPLGLIGFGLYFSLTTLNKNFIGRLLAIVILFMLLAIIDVYQTALHLPILLLLPATTLTKGLRGER